MFDTSDEATEDATDDAFVVDELVDGTWLADEADVFATGEFIDAADDERIPGLVGNGALIWGSGVAVGCAGEIIPHATSVKTNKPSSKNRTVRILIFPFVFSKLYG
jgi:hypothetical protein